MFKLSKGFILDFNNNIFLSCAVLKLREGSRKFQNFGSKKFKKITEGSRTSDWFEKIQELSRSF